MRVNTLKTYLEKNIPFALFRAPGRATRFVAQFNPLRPANDFTKTGFHFVPFSKREKVPHFIIENDVDVLLQDKRSFSFLEKYIPFSLELISQKTFSNKEEAVSYTAYNDHIATYLDFFQNSKTQKAIYSRIKKVELPTDFDLFSFFQKIEEAYPKAMVYIVHLPNIGLWAGASPETLLKYKNGKAETVALAGTQRMLEHQSVDDLDWGDKEIEEHRMVAQYIEEIIKGNDLKISNDSKPYTSQAGAMAHLKQRFEFEITKSELPQFINQLHPTPAVCGLPKEQALNLIYQTEPYDRQYYAGYLGMVEENEEVDFYVNLRCMKIYNNEAALFVGGGITTNSIPEKEWEETELKTKTMMNIIESVTV